MLTFLIEIHDVDTGHTGFRWTHVYFIMSQRPTQDSIETSVDMLLRIISKSVLRILEREEQSHLDCVQHSFGSKSCIPRNDLLQDKVSLLTCNKWENMLCGNKENVCC